jgi:predicted ATPase
MSKIFIKINKKWERRETMKTIKKIVLTGGPCAGKTTAISWIIDNFSKSGYKVMVVAETATELINGGAFPWEAENTVEFQVALYNMLKKKENTYEEIAKNIHSDKVLIVCDRGALDSEAYMDAEQIVAFHNDKQVQATKTQMLDDYDAVFHLITAAKGAIEFYTTANNEARKESPEEAAELDDKTIAAWTGHLILELSIILQNLRKKCRD